MYYICYAHPEHGNTFETMNDEAAVYKRIYAITERLDVDPDDMHVFATGNTESRNAQEWLQELQDKLLRDDRDNSVQAEPVFYGIMHSVQQLVPDGYGDDIELYDINACETVTLDELWDELEDDEKREFAELKEKIIAETGIDLDENGKPYIEDRDAFAEYLSQGKGYETYEYELQDRIAEDALFLTREAAEQHLALNGYHYKQNAHSYAMTAFRSPDVAKLWKLLRTIDWTKSTVILKKE